MRKLGGSPQTKTSIQEFMFTDQIVQKYITQTTGDSSDDTGTYSPLITLLTVNALNHDTPDVKALNQATKTHVPLLQFLVAINPKLSLSLFKKLIKDKAILSLVLTYYKTPESILTKTIKLSAIQPLLTLANSPALSNETVKLLLKKGGNEIVESLVENHNLTEEQVGLVYDNLPAKMKKETFKSSPINENTLFSMLSILAHPNVPVWLLEKYASSGITGFQSSIVTSKKVTDVIINKILFPDGVFRVMPDNIAALLIHVVANRKTSTVTLLKIVTIVNNFSSDGNYAYSVSSTKEALSTVLGKRSTRRMRKELSQFLLTVPGYDETDYSVVPFEWIKELTLAFFKEQYAMNVTNTVSV